MNILGISSHYHDSAACLIRNGELIAAVEEERLTRVKHDNSFPQKAIDFCLRQAKVVPEKLDAVAYYEKPLLKFERIIETFVDTFPRSVGPFVSGIPEWLGQKIKVEQEIRKILPKYKGKIFFIPHHQSHAAASFYPSPFQNSAILTLDGVGEYQTTGMWLGEGNKIRLLKSLDFPHSLGLLYSTFTSFLGFRVNSDEYKMMGLSAYGRPVYRDKIYKTVNVKDDGSFQLNLKYFSFRDRYQMWNSELEKLFGESRNPQKGFSKRHKDIAASIQVVFEEIYLKMLSNLFVETKQENLCVAGGAALNSLANGKIYRNTPFKKVYIFGPSGDSGAALGAALFTHHSLLSQKKRKRVFKLELGSSYDTKSVERTIRGFDLKYKKYSKYEELLNQVVKHLKNGKVIGWFQGSMEFGPRALGARSILARPWPKQMKDRVNLVKRREKFRPFAVSVLQEESHNFFEVPEKNHYSPFMNFVFKVKKNQKRKVAAVVHADGSCRIQTINKRNGIYYKLVKKFHKETGVACILNTSFNLSGEPIVETSAQAINDFLISEIDYLVIEKILVKKN